MILIILSIIWYIYSELISSHEILYNILFLLFYYLLLNIIFNYGKSTIIYFYLKKNKMHQDSTDNFTVGITRLSFFLNHFIFILILVDTFIIKLQNLITSLSLVAVAFVLIFKEYITNFLNGLNLMFSKDFRIKDTVKIGDNKGKIIDFTFHNVQLKTESGDIIYIPNSTFLTKEITNLSKFSLKSITINAILLRKDLKKFEKNKQELLNNIFKTYSEHIIEIVNIDLSISKLEKETFTIIFEIYLLKHSLKLETSIQNYTLTQVGLLFHNK
jgi:small-conductance mechanosensitive channel